MAQITAKRTALTGLIDQGIYSVTNLALAVVVAQVTTAREFGAFSAIFLAYTLIAGVVEAISGETYMVHHSADDRSPGNAEPNPSRRLSRTDARGAVAGFAVGLGLAIGGASILLWAVSQNDSTRALAAFGLALPFLLLQNVWRSVLFADSNPTGALVNDLTWAAVQLVAVGLVIWLWEPTVPRLVLAWASGAVVASVLGVAQTQTVPVLSSGIAWVREHGKSASAFGAEFLTLYGASQLVIAAVGLFAGLEDLARIRVVQLIFGPLNIMVNGARVALTPLAVKRFSATPASFSPLIRNMGLALGGISAIWGVAAVLAPESLWSAAFGDSWDGAARLLLPFGMNRVLLAAGFGAVIGMRALQAVQASLVSRTTASAAAVIAGGLGAVVAGAQGAAWGLLAASVIGVGFMWERYLNALRSAIK